MKRILFLLMTILIGVLVFIGCERHYPEGYVTLENQREHSGIAIEIIELDTFIITGETGHYDLGFLKEGAYHLNFVFPYYKNEKQKIRITHGMLDIPIPDIELQQLLYHTIYADDSVLRLGETIHYVAEVTNQSDIPVPIWWYYTPPWTTVLYDDSCLVSFSFWGFDIMVYDTLFPGETYRGGEALKGGERLLGWVVDTSYKGIVAVSGGIFREEPMGVALPQCLNTFIKNFQRCL
jgi:hypothetical protein